MNGLMKGIGMGVAFGAASLVPLPLLLGGAALYCISEANKAKEPEPEPEPEEDIDIEPGELDELSHVLKLMENSPDPGAVWDEWNV